MKSSVQSPSLASASARGARTGQPFLSRRGWNSRMQQSHQLQGRLRAAVTDTEIQVERAVRFSIQQRVEFGESMRVVGGSEQFGGWNPAAAPLLEWGEDHIWTWDGKLPVGEYEFKVVITRQEGEPSWEDGDNRKLAVAPGDSVVEVNMNWGAVYDMAVVEVPAEGGGAADLSKVRDPSLVDAAAPEAGQATAVLPDNTPASMNAVTPSLAAAEAALTGGVPVADPLVHAVTPEAVMEAMEEAVTQPEEPLPTAVELSDDGVTGALNAAEDTAVGEAAFTSEAAVEPDLPPLEHVMEAAVLDTESDSAAAESVHTGMQPDSLMAAEKVELMAALDAAEEILEKTTEPAELVAEGTVLLDTAEEDIVLLVNVEEDTVILAKAETETTITANDDIIEREEDTAYSTAEKEELLILEEEVEPEVKEDPIAQKLAEAYAAASAVAGMTPLQDLAPNPPTLSDPPLVHALEPPSPLTTAATVESDDAPAGADLSGWSPSSPTLAADAVHTNEPTSPAVLPAPLTVEPPASQALGIHLTINDEVFGEEFAIAGAANAPGGAAALQAGPAGGLTHEDTIAAVGSSEAVVSLPKIKFVDEVVVVPEVNPDTPVVDPEVTQFVVEAIACIRAGNTGVLVREAVAPEAVEVEESSPIQAVENGAQNGASASPDVAESAIESLVPDTIPAALIESALERELANSTGDNGSASYPQGSVPMGAADAYVSAATVMDLPEADNIDVSEAPSGALLATALASAAAKQLDGKSAGAEDGWEGVDPVGGVVDGLMAAVTFAAVPVVGWSLYTLHATGCGLPPGPSGALGAAEGLSYLGVTAMAGYGLYKRATGTASPGYAVAAEVLSYSTVALGLAVLASQVQTYGYVPSALPDSNCFGPGSSTAASLPALSLPDVKLPPIDLQPLQDSFKQAGAALEDLKSQLSVDTAALGSQTSTLATEALRQLKDATAASQTAISTQAQTLSAQVGSSVEAGLSKAQELSSQLGSQAGTLSTQLWLRVDNSLQAVPGQLQQLTAHLPSATDISTNLNSGLSQISSRLPK